MSNRAKSEGLRGQAQTERIALGLAIAEHHARPGEPMPLEVLAEFCGCTDSAIFYIEKDALKKLRERLLFQRDPLLRQLAEEFFERRQPARKTERDAAV